MVVVLSYQFHKALARLSCRVPQLLRNLGNLPTHSKVIHVHNGLLCEQVNHPGKPVFSSYRNLNRHRRPSEFLTNRTNCHVKIGPDSIHLVYEGNPGHFISVSLPPNRFRLSLNPFRSIEDSHCAVEHSQGSFNLDSKVHVPGRVDNVYLAISPVTRRRRGSNRNASLLLLYHPVHRGCAGINLTQTVNPTGIEENTLGCCRLPCIDVCHYAYVSDFLWWRNPKHASPPLRVLDPRATIYNVQRPCWLPPFYAFLLSSSPKLPCSLRRQ
jgi:hypothetical protein